MSLARNFHSPEEESGSTAGFFAFDIFRLRYLYVVMIMLKFPPEAGEV